jgi:hypothetical protein
MFEDSGLGHDATAIERHSENLAFLTSSLYATNEYRW